MAMKITAISAQIKDKNRVNISIDGKYRFSLDIFQLVDLGIKVGHEFDETELVVLEQESQFGKVYSRALEYCLMRPHSASEIKRYLYRKTRSTRDKKGDLKPGIPPNITLRVFNRLTDKDYINDLRFAQYWVENRSLNKGVSVRKLTAELYTKGISSIIINQVLNETRRNDKTEIQKIITKKRTRYPDEKKMILYLIRLGFNYDDIKQALMTNND